MNDARIEAVVTTPSGERAAIPFRWTAQEDGVYEGEWTTLEDGRYEVSVTAYPPGDRETSYGTAGSSFLTVTGAREYFEASQRTEFLQRFAEETGGRYYSLNNAGQLPEEILYTEKQASVVEVLDLWDMPFNLLVLLVLLGAEWIIRKKHGTI
jgi:hypothetical protein